MVGRHVVQALLDRGIAIASASIRSVSLPSPQCSWTAWDLRQWRDPEELEHIFPGVDALLHVGAIVPKADAAVEDHEILDANVRSCLALAQWAEKTGKPMIFLSGSTVYEDPGKQQIRETDPKTNRGFGGFYGFSKKSAEDLLDHIAARGLKLGILRPSSIYGFGLSHEKMIMKFLAQASAGQTIELTPPVEDRVDLIHASDVAEAMLALLEHEAWGVYNIASETPSSMLEIAQACVKAVGKGDIRIMAERRARTPVMRFNLCCDAARKAFHFCPKIVLDKGIERTWNGTV